MLVAETEEVTPPSWKLIGVEIKHSEKPIYDLASLRLFADFFESLCVGGIYALVEYFFDFDEATLGDSAVRVHTSAILEDGRRRNLSLPPYCIQVIIVF